jgi:hypothetical protein
LCLLALGAREAIMHAMSPMGLCSALLEMPEADQAETLEGMSPEDVATFHTTAKRLENLEGMDSRERLAILDAMSPEERMRTIRNMPAEFRASTLLAMTDKARNLTLHHMMPGERAFTLAEMEAKDATECLAGMTAVDRAATEVVIALEKNRFHPSASARKAARQYKEQQYDRLQMKLEKEPTDFRDHVKQSAQKGAAHWGGVKGRVKSGGFSRFSAHPDDKFLEVTINQCSAH